MTTPNFLFKFSNSPNSVANTGTLPANECPNGYPVDKYKGYGINSWEVLYSIWNSYQNSDAALFSAQQCVTASPTVKLCEGPANIFIIRHGEKNENMPDYCLDPNGIYRSCKLLNYVNKLAKDGYPISYIVTCNPCPYNTKDPSMRPVQTISQVSYMFNIPIFIYGGSQDYASIVDALFTQTDGENQYNGLNILICWEHTSTQQLCLSILNQAGALNRLPQTVLNNTVNGNYGDAFFKYVNACPDGNYLCVEGDANYNSTFDPTKADNSLIGPNSDTYPYWSNYNFDNVFILSSNIANQYRYDFSITVQPCYTCYTSCPLKIGLYQPVPVACASSPLYYNKTPTSSNIENECQLPLSWKK